jgi:hypothetical protein
MEGKGMTEDIYSVIKHHLVEGFFVLLLFAELIWLFIIVLKRMRETLKKPEKPNSSLLHQRPVILVINTNDDSMGANIKQLLKEWEEKPEGKE